MIRLVLHLGRCLPAASDLRSDGEMLAAFLHNNDQTAFAELLRRHGPLVWAACRRLLPDPADAEDAFQAAFLVLVRKARRLTHQPAIGPWLYKVAAWTARNVRRRNARTLARRVPLSPTAPDPAPGVTASDTRLDLDAALLALPEKYRAPLVLCHLQGWSRHDAAARLGCPEGTLSSLLARGLARLRAKLVDRDPTPYLAIGSLTVPAALTSATAHAAEAARSTASGTVSVSVSQLAEGVLRMFWVQKATAAAVALAAVFAFGVGVGTTVSYGPASVASDNTAPPTEKASLPTAEVIDRQLAVLREQLDAATEILKNAREGEKLSVEKLKLTEKTGNAKAIAADRETFARFARNVADAEARVADLQDKIAALEAKRRAGGPAQPDPKALPPKVAADDIDRQLLDARDQLIRLKAEWENLARQGERLKEQAALIDARAKELMDLIKILEDQRKRDGKKTESLVAGGSAIEVTVAADKAAWAGSVREYGPDGKLIGTLTYDTTAVLRVLLGRVMLDPKGPRELKITIDKEASAARLKAVLEACKAAGFKDARISGSLPRAGLGVLVRSPDGGEKPVAGWAEYTDTLLSLDEALGTDRLDPSLRR